MPSHQAEAYRLLAAALAVVVTVDCSRSPPDAQAARAAPAARSVRAANVSTGVLAARARGDSGAPRARVPRRDSSIVLDSAAARAAADSAHGFRVVVSLEDRQLWVVKGRDTLRTAPVAVGRDTTLTFEGRVWTFQTPRGIRYVRGKTANPVWVPPDWHYVEEAARQGDLRVARLQRGRPVPLASGDSLVVRDSVAGLVRPSGVFDTLAEDEELIFDSTLYIPPLGTRNRRIPGELGRYRLDLGNGYLLHGTPDQRSIGTATTHGCVRLHDDDIEWLYEHVPVGARVYIY